jgi:uncharacterized RDD family membrane protein YckC
MSLFVYVFGNASCLATRDFQRIGVLETGTVVARASLPGRKKMHAPLK